jgi:putative ABC transport system permease protein
LKVKPSILWNSFFINLHVRQDLYGVGIALGWGFSILLSSFIETAVTIQSVMMAFGISALVGVISGLLPALRAAKLDPIVALRWE